MAVFQPTEDADPRLDFGIYRFLRVFDSAASITEIVLKGADAASDAVTYTEWRAFSSKVFNS